MPHNYVVPEYSIHAAVTSVHSRPKL